MTKVFNEEAALKAYRSSDGTYQPLRLDKITNALVTVDYAHHEIHDGDTFMYHDVIASLADTVVQDYWIVTPNTTRWAHIGHMLESTGPITLQIFEGADRTSAKAEQAVFNRNRNKGAATTKIYKNNATGASSGGATDGTLIVWWKGGISNNKTVNGTTVGTSNEKILKQGTNYIFRITSGMDSNLISLSFDWYEHTDII